MIFDTHIHLNEERLLSNLEQYLKEAEEKGVTKFLCVGWDLDSSKKAIEIANKYKNVYCSIGVIPTEHKQYEIGGKTLKELESLLTTSSKIVAIGEIGLDYYWEKEEEIKNKQKTMFKEQINLANKHNLPISIHSRNSIQDTFDILKSCPVNQSGVMHCYSGSKEMATEFIKLGYKIAFGGVLTFKNSKETKEVLSNIPLESIVFETDAPYLAPTPYRGKINLPEYIFNVVQEASLLKKVDFKEFSKITYENSLKIFHVKSYED